jgi:hypothetical protein
MDKDVTFVVIGLNESATLDLCFKSIKKITNNIIYIDSNSIDGSIKIAQKNNIRKIIKINSNYHSATLARFIGARHVKTKYIQFLDGDMTVEKDWIKLAITRLESNNSIAAVLGFKRVFSENFESYILLKDKEEFEPDYMGGAFCINAKKYRLAGEFDIDLPAEEERDLYVRIKHNKNKVVYLNSLMASHFDFKSSNRGVMYSLTSYRAASIFLPLLNAIKKNMLFSWVKVYKKMIPTLIFDIVSIALLFWTAFFSLSLSFAVAGALFSQVISILYAISINRKGYFIIWKSGLLGIFKIIKILNRKVVYSEEVIS